MKSLTTHLLATAPNIDAAFRAGVDSARAGVKPRADYAVLASVRARHGFMALEAPLLTPPFANVKLAKGVVPSYGLTLHHFRTVLEATDSAPRLSLNVCPWAGHCVKVCVLNNGNGRYDSTQRGWLWRTDLLARHPEAFARILTWELVRAVRKHDAILFRPNVNSDVSWHLVLPSLCDGYLQGVTSYGYSKDPATLDTDGWLGAAYRVAYSWNERADAGAVRSFLARGGSVAVVTARRKGTGVHASDAYRFALDILGAATVLDADKTDEWIFTRGAVGDLSAKGKARALIGHSAFVVGAEPVAMRKRAA